MNVKNQYKIISDTITTRSHFKLLSIVLFLLCFGEVFLIYRCIIQLNNVKRENNTKLALISNLKQIKADNNDLSIQMDNSNKAKSLLEEESTLTMKALNKLKLENEDFSNLIVTNRARQEVLKNQLNKKNEMNNQLESISQLYQEKSSLEYEIDLLTINTNNIKLQLNKKKINSSILSSNDHLDLILKWLNIYKPFKLELLYKKSIDGYSPQVFHEKCDHYITLILIKTDKDMIFGGFTKVSWGDPGFQYDPNAFMFNLSLRKKYEVSNPQFALYGGSGYLAVFGFSDLVMDQNIIYSKFPGSYGAGSFDLELTGGEQIIKAVEIEVFGLKHDN